uniref:Olfactory receptor 14C36-like n=1 Tax=Jaculus jaculus TaxID=51337 RepID=A0A8C5LD55_JACJA
MDNSTQVTEFLLQFLAESWELRLLLSMLFLLMYLATLLGNLLIILATTLDQNLHTPMYFFLRNLSILDMCYISVTVPNACVNSLTDNRVISMAGCATQIFMFFFCACAEILFLTVMAHDRYVAICQPLLYPVIMSHQFSVQMTLASVLGSLVIASAHTSRTFQLSFCQSLLLTAIGLTGSCFLFIAISYVYIFSTVLKFPVKEEQGKAFSTCVPHIAVVSMFLSFGAYVYLKPPGVSEVVQDMVLSVFYTIVPPFLNSIIYSFRNKIKEALRSIILRSF